MTTSQIRTNTEKISELFERIDELKSYINQLTDGVMSRLGNKLENKAAIQEYNMRIVNLEAEIKALWNNH